MAQKKRMTERLPHFSVIYIRTPDWGTEEKEEGKGNCRLEGVHALPSSAGCNPEKETSKGEEIGATTAAPSGILPFFRENEREKEIVHTLALAWTETRERKRKREIFLVDSHRKKDWRAVCLPCLDGRGMVLLRGMKERNAGEIAN